MKMYVDVGRINGEQSHEVTSRNNWKLERKRGVVGAAEKNCEFRKKG